MEKNIGIHNNPDNNTQSTETKENNNTHKAPETPTMKHTYKAKGKLKTVCTTASTNMKKVFSKLTFKCVTNWLGRLLRNGLVAAILLHVAASFYPELPARFPTVWAFFDGFFAIGEYVYKVAIGGIASIFTGEFFTFMDSAFQELGELLQAFAAWASSLKF